MNSFAVALERTDDLVSLCM